MAVNNIAFAGLQRYHVTTKKEGSRMNSKEIWVAANQRRDLVRPIYYAMVRGKSLDPMMTNLKKEMPCLYGADDEKRALVFRSTDEGLVAIYLAEADGDFALALGANIQLD
jgi:hypothetical protein